MADLLLTSRGGFYLLVDLPKKTLAASLIASEYVG